MPLARYSIYLSGLVKTFSLSYLSAWPVLRPSRISPQSWSDGYTSIQIILLHKQGNGLSVSGITGTILLTSYITSYRALPIIRGIMRALVAFYNADSTSALVISSQTDIKHKFTNCLSVSCYIFNHQHIWYYFRGADISTSFCSITERGDRCTTARCRSSPNCRAVPDRVGSVSRGFPNRVL